MEKNKSYYYCNNYFNKKYTSYSIEKKLERTILEELKVDEIARNYLYEKVNVIYINNDKTISTDYKRKKNCYN